MQDKIPPPTPVSELSVLVIDNQPLVHDVVNAALAQTGFKKISNALNAFHALRLCEQNQFDFVLIAFNVSNDKDGFHLFEELKHYQFITNKTTVIFLSAETNQALVNCIVELQPDDFWVKPLDRQRIEQRLKYLIDIRSRLHKLLFCLQQRDFSTAMYHAQRHLQDNSIAEYHNRLRRIIGDCFFQLREFAEAENYFRELSKTINHAWAHIGLARSLLKLDKTQEAQDLIDELVLRSDTRFLSYDLMAQHYIEKEQFEAAYKQVKHASRLAPRNIERNKRLWDLARLNRDKAGQLSAVQNMAKYAKNSIHDSPELKLNVIRSTLDLATTLSSSEAERLLKKMESELTELRQQQGMERQLGEQISIISARLMCLRDKKKAAEEIMKTKKPITDSFSVEDNLDKMKAFHELGMKEHCLSLLDQLRKQIAGDTLSSQVVNEYLKQEAIERKEINFTTKELKQMAAINYKENRMVPAYNNLRQALTLSPHNRPIALSLLKVLVQLQSKDTLTQQQQADAEKAAAVLMTENLAASQIQQRDQFFRALSISIHKDAETELHSRPL